MHRTLCMHACGRVVIAKTMHNLCCLAPCSSIQRDTLVIKRRGHELIRQDLARKHCEDISEGKPTTAKGGRPARAGRPSLIIR